MSRDRLNGTNGTHEHGTLDIEELDPLLRELEHQNTIRNLEDEVEELRTKLETNESWRNYKFNSTADTAIVALTTFRAMLHQFLPENEVPYARSCMNRACNVIAKIKLAHED